MSKQVIAVVVALVVVGGAAFFYMRGDGVKENINTAPMMEDGTDVSAENTNSNTKKMSFESFAKNGGSYVCTVTQNVQDIESNGTIYMDGGKMRGEFNTSVQGMNVGTTFIAKDGYSYTWSSIMPNTGYKVAIAQDSVSGNSTAGTSGSYGFNAEQIGNYDCQPWTVDNSKFVLPTSIKFSEIKK